LTHEQNATGTTGLRSEEACVYRHCYVRENEDQQPNLGGR
jgi:hypothetical protein